MSTNNEIMERWRGNILFFVKEAIGAVPSNQQEEGLLLVQKVADARYKKSLGLKLSKDQEKYAGVFGISIRSGHGTGKDAWLAWIFIWLLFLFKDAQGLVTAPTSDQLKDILWTRLSMWIRKSKVELWRHIEIQTDKIFLKVNKREAFISARTCNVKASADEQNETLSGRHGDYMVMAVDEASGVPNPVFGPIEGAMSGKMNFAILIGNPTRNSGYFFDTHNKHRHMWACLHWDCEKSNIQEIVPGMDVFVERMKKKYSKDTNIYRIRVKGEFPKADPDSLIPLEWVMDAVDRDLEVVEGMPVIFGVDVARYGTDKSVILIRQGNVVIEILEFNKIDTMELTGWVSCAMADYNPNAVYIDIIGIGAGVYDRLRELGKNNVYSVCVSETASEEDKFKKLRDELWWRLREKFEQRTIKIPNDDELIGELSTIRYKPESDGTIKVEGKPEMKKRGIESPNKADALCLTYSMSDTMFMPPVRDPYDEEETAEIFTEDSFMGA